jgi:hypothetical protein
MSKKKLFNKIIKEIKPAMYKKIISHKGNLLDDHLLDSFFKLILSKHSNTFFSV